MGNIINFEDKAVTNDQLTKEQIERIGKELEEVSSQNTSVKVLREVNEEEHIPEEGEMVPAEILIAEDGSKSMLRELEDSEIDDATKNRIEEFGKSLDNYEFNVDDINKDDVIEVLSDENNIIGGTYDLSDNSVLELLEVIKKYKKTGKITYKMLPDEVKGYIDDYLKKQGVVTYSVENNTIRNTIAVSLMDEYISNIEMNKFQSEFNNKIESIYDEMSKEVSPLFKEYDESTKKTLQDLIDNAQDEEKKQLAINIFDSVKDASELTRLKEVAPRTKIKKFDIEKPQRITSSIYNKYNDNQYKLYDLKLVTGILDKHLKLNGYLGNEDETSTIKFILLFCKLCQNYSPKNPVEHAFMYYFTYNIVLLNIFKGNEYDQYIANYLPKVKEIIDLMK